MFSALLISLSATDGSLIDNIIDFLYINRFFNYDFPHALTAGPNGSVLVPMRTQTTFPNTSEEPDWHMPNSMIVISSEHRTGDLSFCPIHDCLWPSAENIATAQCQSVTRRVYALGAVFGAEEAIAAEQARRSTRRTRHGSPSRSMLREGYLADWTALSVDPLLCAPESIRTAIVTATAVWGQNRPSTLKNSRQDPT